VANTGGPTVSRLLFELAVVGVLAAFLLAACPGIGTADLDQVRPARVETEADSIGRLLRSISDKGLALLPAADFAEAVALSERMERGTTLTESELVRLHELNLAAIELLPPADRALWYRLVAEVMRQYGEQEFPATAR
jgi:hypothetical protein